MFYLAFTFVIKLLQRADDLEKYRKSLETPKATPHEKAVDQYVQYARTQMLLIPQESWFRFTVENMQMIQHFVTGRQNRQLGGDLSRYSPGQAQKHDLPYSQSVGQSVGFNLTQSGMMHRGQTPNIMATPGTFQSPGTLSQVTNPVSLAQALISPVVPTSQGCSSFSTISPTSFLNLQGISYQQSSPQNLLAAPATSVSIGSSSVGSTTKPTNTTTEANATETTSTDVIAFTDQFFQ